MGARHMQPLSASLRAAVFLQRIGTCVLHFAQETSLELSRLQPGAAATPAQGLLVRGGNTRKAASASREGSKLCVSSPTCFTTACRTSIPELLQSALMPARPRRRL
eukprot:15479160-Alexandrium_andersonii.AAC.1